MPSPTYSGPSSQEGSKLKTSKRESSSRNINTTFSVCKYLVCQLHAIEKEQQDKSL